MSSQNSNPIKNTLWLTTQTVIGIGIVLALLFIPAGRLDWWAAWTFIGVYFAAVYIGVAFLQRKDPELIKERQQVKKDVKPWDRVITLLFSLIFIPLTLIISGFDQRFGWSAPFPITIQLIAFLLGILCFVLIFWGMATNTHFESYVRIQDDRKHKPITSGPYKYIRHPGYVGMALSALMLPLMLGSWWALIPGGIAVSLIVIRTALEDKTLQEELPGYVEYTKQTRYRLIPGIW